jgi:hypothetical protein
MVGSCDDSHLWFSYMGSRVRGSIDLLLYTAYDVGVRQAGKPGHDIAVRRGHCASMRVWLKVQGTRKQQETSSSLPSDPFNPFRTACCRTYTSCCFRREAASLAFSQLQFPKFLMSKKKYALSWCFGSSIALKRYKCKIKSKLRAVQVLIGMCRGIWMCFSVYMST